MLATLTMRFLIGLDALLSEVDKAILCQTNTAGSALVRDEWRAAVDAPWSWSWSWVEGSIAMRESEPVQAPAFFGERALVLGIFLRKG